MPDLSRALQTVPRRLVSMPIGGGEVFRLYVGQASDNNPAFRSAVLKADEAQRKAKGNATAERDANLRFTAEALFLGWPDGEAQWEGEPMEPTVENRLKLLEASSELAVFVNREALKGFWRADQEEEAETAKN